MLKLSDLALRPDLQLGSLRISPSRRLVEGPEGQAHVEPLIMQAFLILLDAGGRVVTRNELFDQCWGGSIVGDDSLNRAIAKIRRTGAEVAPGFFEIETIPRTGYRLTGDILQSSSVETVSPGSRPRTVSRRTLVTGAVVTAAAVAGGGTWWLWAQESREFQELMARGEEALDGNDPADRAVKYFQQAVDLRPDDAKAQGRLAFSHALKADNAASAGNSLQEAQRAIANAFSIDPNEPHARLAELLLQSGTLDLRSTEDRLRQILAADPNNLHTMRQLWNLLQCAGRSRDALALVERSLRLKPLAATAHYPRAQLLWITGRTAEADRVIEKAMQFWPAHRFVRFARFTILAFTGRPRAALAMIASEDTAPQNFTPAAIALWRASLPALEQRSPSTIAAAAKANLEAVKTDLRLSNQASMVMSALGELDAAFEITDAFFALGSTSTDSPDPKSPPRSTAWRFAPWMFTPPTAAMRADPRFQRTVDAIGLTEYWRASKVRPDYLAFPD